MMINFKVTVEISRKEFPYTGLIPPKINRVIQFDAHASFYDAQFSNEKELKSFFHQWLDMNKEEMIAHFKNEMDGMIKEYVDKFEFEVKEGVGQDGRD